MAPLYQILKYNTRYRALFGLYNRTGETARCAIWDWKSQVGLPSQYIDPQKTPKIPRPKWCRGNSAKWEKIVKHGNNYKTIESIAKIDQVSLKKHIIY